VFVCSPPLALVVGGVPGLIGANAFGQMILYVQLPMARSSSSATLSESTLRTVSFTSLLLSGTGLLERSCEAGMGKPCRLGRARLRRCSGPVALSPMRSKIIPSSFWCTLRCLLWYRFGTELRELVGVGDSERMLLHMVEWLAPRRLYSHKALVCVLHTRQKEVFSSVVLEAS
jgi:hypothetical protein